MEVLLLKKTFSLEFVKKLLFILHRVCANSCIVYNTCAKHCLMNFID